MSEEKNTLQKTAPGLSLEKILKDVGHELKANVAHGAHELAAALFNGSAFVMYPRGTREDGKEQDQQVDLPQRQQERGGRSM